MLFSKKKKPPRKCIDVYLFGLQWSRYKVYTIFQQFGDILSIEPVRGPAERYWKITYDSVKSVAKLLLKRKIVYENVNIYIRAPKKPYYEYRYTTAENMPGELSETPDEDSPKNMYNALNDDCLRVVFAKLHVLDLVSVADICVRFNEIAKEIFRLRYKRKVFDFHDLKRSKDDEFTLKHVAGCLRNFGPLIKSMSFSYLNHAFMHSKYIAGGPNVLLGIINKYCIELNDIDICADVEHVKTFSEIIPLFERLKKLRISFTIRAHNQSQSSAFFNFIRQHCPNVRELDFSTKVRAWLEPELACFSELVNLKKLRLRLSYHVSVSLLMHALCTKHVPIEELTLEWADIDDDTIDCITQMKQISHLELYADSLKDRHLTEITEKLPNLTNIGIYNGLAKGVTMHEIKNMLHRSSGLTTLKLQFGRITEADFIDIVRIVKNRTNNTKLNVVVYGWRGCSSVNQQNLAKHSNIKKHLFFYFFFFHLR